jgi:hypothetical protein
LEEIPIPLPSNYLLGIDHQKYDFELDNPSYLRGEWSDAGWWYYYLYGLAVKMPLGTLALVFLALVLQLFGKLGTAPRADTVLLLVPVFYILFLVSSQTGLNHHVRYVFPILPFVFIWTSQVATAASRGVRGLAYAALACTVLRAYPKTLTGLQ